MIAAHQTMLAPQSAPLGSVEFTRGGGLNNPLHASGVLSAIPSAWTVSLWAKSATASGYGGFFKLGNQADGGGIGLGMGGNRFQSGYSGSNLVVLREGVAWDNLGSAGTLAAWHHYAIAVNGTSYIAYRDGAQFATITGDVRTSGSCDIGIGTGYSNDPMESNNRNFAGKITRLALWNRALSASEIATDYADGKNTPTATSGLEHYWPMSSAGNYLADAVGSASLTAGTGGVTISTDSPFA